MAQKGNSFSWGKLKVEQVTTPLADDVQSVSNGNALAILFNKASFDFQGPTSPNAFTWVTSLSVPFKIEGKSKSLYFHEVLRGLVAKDKDSRIVLVFDLGGELHVQKYDYGSTVDEDLFIESIFRAKAYETSIYNVTILIAIERQALNSMAFVEIASLDVEASDKKPQSNRKIKRD